MAGFQVDAEVELKQAAESLVTLNRSTLRASFWKEEFVVFPLMVSFVMVMVGHTRL
jgi:hypothetical protein